MIGKAQYTRVKIIFLIATIFLLALSVLSYVRIRNLVEASDLVNHTQAVKLQLERIPADMTDAETNQKTYLLTGDSSALVSRDGFLNKLTDDLQSVKTLVNDNPRQIANIALLRTAISLKLLSMNEVMLQDTSKEKSPGFARAVNEGTHLTENIKKQINTMENEEDRLLIVRSASLKHSAFITPLLTVFLVLGAIIILIASYFTIMRELHKSQKLRSEIESSELQLQTILKNAPDAVITIDADGIITSWNTQAEDIFGWKEQELIGKTLAETIIPERYREQHTTGIRRFLKTGEGAVINKPIEIFALKKDKTEFPVELKISSSRLDNSYMFIGFVRDISFRRKMDEVLKNKTTQLVEAQQLAHIGSWEWHVPNNKIEWSDELYRIYGLAPQEFEADYESFLKYVHPDDREYVNGIVQQAFQTHEPFNFDHKLVCSDGTVKAVTSTGRVFTDNNGNTIRMAGTAQDVTRQKEYEAELKESEERFLKIFDYNPVPMTLSEIKTNKIKYANKLFYAAFGYSEEEVIGHTSEELHLIGAEENQRITVLLLGYLQENRSVAELQALSLEETEELLIKLKQTDAMKNLEVLYTRKNGETFPAVVSFEVIRFGTERYTIASYQDITERKNAQEQLTRQNESLVKANKELESFAYISSHDLQEPLRQIQNFASRITDSEKQALSEKANSYFNKINNAAFRMQTLIADLLAYSRTKTAERKFEITDLNQIVKEVTEELTETIETKQATIEIGELCDANVIPFQFRQMMHNLIGNALKFSKPGTPPHIIIKNEIIKYYQAKGLNLSPEKEYCHISISDNGIGFEPQYKDRIFEVFQRLHDLQHFNGTGVGLAIVKKIVENHNGVITATGELNKGATFDVYIPSA